MKRTLLLLAFLLIFLGGACAEIFYPTTTGELEAIVKLHGYGTIEGLKAGEKISFQTLTFHETPFQEVRVIKEELYINGKTLYPEHMLDEYNNKYVIFSITENGGFTYELTADVNISSAIYPLNDYDITAADEKLAQFVSPSEKIESDSTEIMTLSANKLTKKSFNETLNTAIQWVGEYVEYATGEDFDKYYLLQKSAVETLYSKKGVCDEYANLAAGMLRAKGIPTRMAIGTTFDGLEWGNHAWIEVYHKSLGWVPSDPTFKETGFVDATHIKIATFSDVSESIAKATFPSTAKVSFQTQTIPVVVIKSTKYFDDVNLSIPPINLKARQWNEVPITVQNNTEGVVTAPIRIKENYNSFFFEEKNNSVLLMPLEKKIVTFKIYPNIDLKSDEKAAGTLTFNTLNAPVEREMTINYSPTIGGGPTKVLDVAPIASNEKLWLIIKTSNYSPEESQIKITYMDSDGNRSWQETIAAFSEKTFKEEVPAYKEELLSIRVETPTETFIQTIFPIKQRNVIIPVEPGEIIITQPIIMPQDENPLKGLENAMKMAPLILIAIMLLVVVLVLGLLFATRRRYV